MGAVVWGGESDEKWRFLNENFWGLFLQHSSHEKQMRSGASWRTVFVP